jgi:hypothetical protein
MATINKIYFNHYINKNENYNKYEKIILNIKLKNRVLDIPITIGEIHNRENSITYAKKKDFVFYRVFYQKCSDKKSIPYFQNGTLQVYYDEPTIPLFVQLANRLIIKSDTIIIDDLVTIPVTEKALNAIKNPVDIIELTDYKYNICDIWWTHPDQHTCWKKVAEE